MAIAAVSTFTGAHAVRLVAGTGWVGASAIAGLDTAGTVWAAVSALAAAGSLWLAIAANNRARRKEYAEEIRRAEQRGSDQARLAADSRIRELVDELKEARSERNLYRQQWVAKFGAPPPLAEKADDDA